MKIRCNEIVTPAGVIDGLVIVEDGKITQIVPAAELKGEAWDEDWRGYKLLPGLIDIHTHGYYGYSALSTKSGRFSRAVQTDGGGRRDELSGDSGRSQ